MQEHTTGASAALTEREKVLAAMLATARLYLKAENSRTPINAIREFGKHLDRYLDEREKGK